jgi:Protein of unknown function (DUF2442)
LAGAKVSDLRTIQIQAAGLSLHWPKLDADLNVQSLVKGMLGTKKWMAEIGADGGSTTSAAKAQSYRANGKLGGRLKKLDALRAD